MLKLIIRCSSLIMVGHAQQQSTAWSPDAVRWQLSVPWDDNALFVSPCQHTVQVLFSSLMQPKPLWSVGGKQRVPRSLSHSTLVMLSWHQPALSQPSKQASARLLLPCLHPPCWMKSEAHNSLLQSVEVAPQDAAMFWSAAEDGQLRQYDLRLR